MDTLEGIVTDQSGMMVIGAKATMIEKTAGRLIDLRTQSDGYVVSRSFNQRDFIEFSSQQSPQR